MDSESMQPLPFFDGAHQHQHPSEGGRRHPLYLHNLPPVGLGRVFSDGGFHGMQQGMQPNIFPCPIDPVLLPGPPLSNWMPDLPSPDDRFMHSASTSSPFTPSSAMTLPTPIPTLTESFPSSISFCTSLPPPPDHSFPPSEETDESEDAWNLIPYDIAWGSSYHGYARGTLPGPDGNCLFLRSPTPIKNQRTTQACEKCRERKAKCSGTRPSCTRCDARGHLCVYAPEQRKPQGTGKRRRNSPSGSSPEYITSPSPSPRLGSLALPDEHDDGPQPVRRSSRIARAARRSTTSSVLLPRDLKTGVGSDGADMRSRSNIPLSHLLRGSSTLPQTDAPNSPPSSSITLPTVLPIHAPSPVPLRSRSSLPHLRGDLPATSHSHSLSLGTPPSSDIRNASVPWYSRDGYPLKSGPLESSSSSSSSTSPSMSVRTPLSEAPPHFSGAFGFDAQRRQHMMGDFSYTSSLQGLPQLSPVDHHHFGSTILSDGGSFSNTSHSMFSKPGHSTGYSSTLPSDWHSNVSTNNPLYYLSQLDAEMDSVSPYHMYNDQAQQDLGLNAAMGFPPTHPSATGTVHWRGYPIKREEFY